MPITPVPTPTAAQLQTILSYESIRSAVTSDNVAAAAMVIAASFADKAIAGPPGAVLVMRSTVLTMVSATEASLGLSVPYLAGRKMIVSYMLWATSNAATGFNLKMGTMPTGSTGIFNVVGPLGVLTAVATIRNAVPTTATTANFLSIAGSGLIRVDAAISGGTADGTIDLRVVPGTGQTGTFSAQSNATYFSAV